MQVGTGAGLSSLCLAQLKASKVYSSLTNLFFLRYLFAAWCICLSRTAFHMNSAGFILKMVSVLLHFGVQESPSTNLNNMYFDEIFSQKLDSLMSTWSLRNG